MVSGLTFFPARVATPDGSFDKAKVFVYDGTATVWQVVDRRVVEVTRLEGVESYREQPGEGMRKATVLVAQDGTEWTVTKGAGCGCSSPLKKMQPPAARPLRASR